MRILLLAVVALVSTACAVVPSAVSTPPPAPAPSVAPIVPTPLPPPPPTPVPTPVPTQVEVKREVISAPPARGLAVWRDDILRNDALFVSTEDLPNLPAGQEYSVWLSGADGVLPLGNLAPGAAARLDLTFVAPDQQNLLAGYDSISIGRSVNEPILTGSLPEKALVHVRHVLVGISVTPNEIGFGLGLRKETEEMLRHAQFLVEAMDEGNLPLEKLHAEHLINLIEGASGEHFGDLNGNGKVDNPGDGYGVLEGGDKDGYVTGMREHAKLAASAADATDEIKLHAGHVQVTGENTRTRTSEIRDRALEILKARNVASTRLDAQKTLSLAHQTIQGVDVNGDELVAPVPGEGGVTVAYQHAQMMASIALKRPSTPTVVTEPTPTPVAHEHVAPKEVRISIGDNVFAPKSVSVPKGSVVTWTQDGQRPHTVTADDAAFHSGLMRNGGTFSQTFNEPGVYLYFCELHGGPGGAGMAAEIKVEN
jgi:plastocyanin